MFKIFITLTLMCYSVMQSRGCEVCGCALSSHQFGILPQFQRHMVALRFDYRSFESTHPPLFSNDVIKTSYERFYITQVWTRFALGKKWQIFAFVPIQLHHKIEDEISTKNFGLGDISLMSMYNLIENRQIGNSIWNHNLQIGGGIKLPTGAYDMLDHEGYWIPGLQLGSGTVDWLANINYILRTPSLGFLFENSFRINNYNSETDFEYGDRFLTALNVFYVSWYKDKQILPTGGLVFEYSGQDLHDGVFNEFSGEHNLGARVGVDMFHSGFATGISATLPINQEMGGSNIKSGIRFNAYFSLIF